MNEQTASGVTTGTNEVSCLLSGKARSNKMRSEWQAVTERAGLTPPAKTTMLRPDPDTPLLPHYNLRILKSQVFFLTFCGFLTIFATHSGQTEKQTEKFLDCATRARARLSHLGRLPGLLTQIRNNGGGRRAAGLTFRKH